MQWIYKLVIELRVSNYVKVYYKTYYCKKSIVKCFEICHCD